MAAQGRSSCLSTFARRPDYGTSHLRFPRPIFPSDHVLSIWQDEFRMIREWGGVYVLVMH
jgi:hypothetical protein